MTDDPRLEMLSHIQYNCVTKKLSVLRSNVFNVRVLILLVLLLFTHFMFVVIQSVLALHRLLPDNITVDFIRVID